MQWRGRTNTNRWLHPTSIWQTGTRKNWPSSTTFQSPMTFTWRTDWLYENIKAALKCVWRWYIMWDSVSHFMGQNMRRRLKAYGIIKALVLYLYRWSPVCKYFFLCALQCSLSTHGCILVTETSYECTDFHSLFGRPTHIYGTDTVHTHKETVSLPRPTQHLATLKGIVH